MSSYRTEPGDAGTLVVIVEGTTPFRQEWDPDVAGQRIMTQARADQIGQRLAAEPTVTIDKAQIRADGIDVAVITIQAAGATSAHVRLPIDGDPVEIALVAGVGSFSFALDQAGYCRLQVGAAGFYQEVVIGVEAIAP
jgi:hypothetical protein